MFRKVQTRFQKKIKRLSGFSLGELLIVITLIVILAITVIMAYQNQLSKARDTTRKADLGKYIIAFEDYYNDNGCYPTKEVWDACECGSACLAPYMDKFLCDPATRQKYYYFPFSNEEGIVDSCIGCRLYAKLENTGDPDIRNVGCSPTLGCGEGLLASYNYGIAIGGPLTAADFNPNITPTPTSAYPPGCESANGPWACAKGGTCNSVGAGAFSSGQCSVGFSNAICCQNSLCPKAIWCKW